MKRNGLMLLLVLTLLLLSACSGQSATKSEGNSASSTPAATDDSANKGDQKDDGKVYTLKIGSALTDSDPIYQGLMTFSKNVSEKTNGKVNIEIYGSGSLGEDSDILEQAKVGANVGVLVDAGRLAEMVPDMGIIAAPYIFDNYDEANKFTQSDLFKGWEDQLAKEQNLQVLSFNWYQGQRNVLTNKLIEKPEDLKGLKLRTPGAPIWLETLKAMGATPAGLAWTEVYPGIQQGVIDGAEAQDPATYGAKLYEVIDHIALTGHFQLITGVVVNAKWMQALPEEYQQIIYDEAVKAGEDASHKTESMIADFEQKMKDAGVQFNEVDKSLFKAKTDVVYDKFEGYRDLRKQVNQILGK